MLTTKYKRSFLFDGTQLGLELGLSIYGKNKKTLENIKGCVINGAGSGTIVERILIMNHGKVLHRYDDYWLGTYVPTIMERQSSWFETIGRTAAFEIETGVMEGDGMLKGNPSALNRANLCQKSEPFYLFSTLNLPIFSTEKVVPLHQTNLNIEISFLPDCMSLLKEPAEEETLELYIEKASIHMKLLEPHEGVATSLASNGVYGTRDFSVSKYTLLEGTVSKSLPYNTWTKTPAKIYMCMVDEEALSKQTKNPLYFSANDIESLQVTANERLINLGEDMVFLKNAELSEYPNVGRLYAQTFQMIMGNSESALEYTNFCKNYAIFLADLTSKNLFYP